MKLKKTLLSLFLALAPASLAAEPLDLHCTIKVKDGDWVMPEMLIMRSARTDNKLLVVDGMIYEYNDKKPIEARVMTDTADRLVISWRIDGESLQSQSIRLRSTADLNKKTGAVKVSANLLEHNQRDFARGSCKPR